MKWFNLSDTVNLFGFVAALLILIVAGSVSYFYVKSMKDQKAEGEFTDHEWDGIEEFKNDLPIGWAAVFLALIVWGMWYIFFGYPLSSFSQIGEYNKDMSAHNSKYASKWENLSPEQLVSMGESMFAVQCAGCHGINAEGMDGKAANLTNWGKEQGIMYTEAHGSEGLGFAAGMMPPLPLSSEDAKAVAAYIMADISAVKKSEFPNLVAAGKAIYDGAGTCSTCHGPDGKGNVNMPHFAANLSEYGTPAFLKLVLEHGKRGHVGVMPSFKYANFTDIQIKALNAYIRNLTPSGK